MDMYFEMLVVNLNLNNYQINKLQNCLDRYDLTRLQKRGGVLFVPYKEHGVWPRLVRCLFGERADVIGVDRMLLQNQRNVRFCKNGYHSVRVGRYTYYANALGQVVSQQEFLDNLLSY